MSKRSRDSSSHSSRSQSAPESSNLDRGDVDETHVAKVVAVDSSLATGRTGMNCSLPPHDSTLEFPSLEAFEVHYAQNHTNRCSSCGKNFPSAHYLALHIDEHHNPMHEALAAKGEKTFGCFLPDCDRKCSTAQKRRLHMIDKHDFPKFYNFRVINYGIDNATSLLHVGRRRRISTVTDSSAGHQSRASTITHPSGDETFRLEHVTASQVEDGKTIEKSSMSVSIPIPSVKGNQDVDDDGMKDLETSFSTLGFVPRSVVKRQSQLKARNQESP